MDNKINLIIILVLIIPMVSCLVIEDTTFHSTESNSKIFVEEIELDAVNVTANYTEFYNFSGLNILQNNHENKAYAYVYQLKNAYITYSNGSILCGNSTLCGGNKNITISPYNDLIIYNNYNPNIPQEAVEETQFLINFDNFTAVVFALFFITGILITAFWRSDFGGTIFILLGFTLLFSTFNPILSFLLIAGGVVTIFVIK